MTSYLLTWNPKNWAKEKFNEYYSRYELGEVLRWSCGNTKKIMTGDLIYLLKQGKGNTGVIGSGSVVEAPYREKHYDEDKALKGETALYVDVKFEYLVHPDKSIPIRRDELQACEMNSSIWTAQGSGKSIPQNIEAQLTELWLSRVELKEFIYPEELPFDIVVEGAKSTIQVNSYERNPEARRKCLEKWGHTCSVCRFHFELFYGSMGKHYIHVHHLKPIATIGEEYKIDPINDLRPVCPNCHAMLHKENPPISIEELKKLVSTYGGLPR